MGQRGSKGAEAVDNNPHSNGDVPAASETVTAKAPRPVFHPPTLKFVGFASTSDEEKYRLVPADAAAYIHAAIPVAQGPAVPVLPSQDEWYLLYNSNIHGRSFNRMVQLITDMGPTVIVIKDGNSGRIFGGYNETSWATVAQREKEAKSRAAANLRAKREGIAADSSGKAANQANVFFGNERCFLFSCIPSVNEAPPVTLFTSRPNVNANFMYLFDTHSDDDRIGIGMGGQAQYFGWFLDRWLEHGSCRGIRCQTFHNPMLSAVEEWPIESVEVYAVGAEGVASIKEKTRDLKDVGDGRSHLDTGASIRKGADRKVDKIILEMDERHHFYADTVDPSDSEEEDHCGRGAT